LLLSISVYILEGYGYTHPQDGWVTRKMGYSLSEREGGVKWAILCPKEKVELLDQKN